MLLASAATWILLAGAALGAVDGGAGAPAVAPLSQEPADLLPPFFEALRAGHKVEALAFGLLLLVGALRWVGARYGAKWATDPVRRDWALPLLTVAASVCVTWAAKFHSGVGAGAALWQALLAALLAAGGYKVLWRPVKALLAATLDKLFPKAAAP